MKEPNAVVADVRAKGDSETGHIPGAVCIGYEKIESGEEASFLPDRNQLIIVYCAIASVREKAAEKLVSDGYTNVVEFAGLEDWKGEVEPGACC